MSVAVNPPKTPVTEGSKGIAAATMPNVCKMPGPPAPFVPTPLPNIGKSGSSPKDYSKDVEIEKKKVAIRGATFKSMGDVASKGTGGGIVSSNTEGPTRFVGPGSLNVKIEGKNVQFLSDPMLNNCGPSGSPPNSATMVGLLQNGSLKALVGDEMCPICDKTHGEDGKLEETVDTKGDATKLYNRARDISRTGEAPQFTMLGVVHCKDKKVYATNSKRPWYELSEAVHAYEWHAFPRTPNISDADRKAKFKERFKKHAVNKTAFDGAWDDAAKYALKFTTHRKKQDAKGKITTARSVFPPGSCAAQKGVLLCLDHGGRPAGLTERAYHNTDPNHMMHAYVRDEIGGIARFRKFGGEDAIPPCKSCEIILTALMCTKDKSLECNHTTNLEEGYCTCNTMAKST